MTYENINNQRQSRSKTARGPTLQKSRTLSPEIQVEIQKSIQNPEIQLEIQKSIRNPEILTEIHASVRIRKTDVHVFVYSLTAYAQLRRRSTVLTRDFKVSTLERFFLYRKESK